MKDIPMLDLGLEYEYMKSHIDAAIFKCLKHQKWILGPEVRELEERVSQCLGSKFCIGVSSGTEALVLSLRALSIHKKKREFFSKNDLIITTPFTFSATGEAILRAGATPVFIDIDETFNIDPKKVEKFMECILTKEKVVGIIPVHLFGQACDMDLIMSIAKKYDLFVLEDVAQAFGGMWDEQSLGTIGDLGSFSFFPSKNLGGFGDGGMVVTNNEELADIVRVLLSHGGKDKYNVQHIGYNARLDTVQAAILLVKLMYVVEFNFRRRKLAKFYDKELEDLSTVATPLTLDLAHHVYHQYTILVEYRDKIKKFLQDRKISTAVYYPFPLHKMDLFKSENSIIFEELKNSERAAENVLSLPIEPLQSEQDSKYIVECIKEFRP